MVWLQSFCLELSLLFLLSCFSSDMVCLQTFFVFVFFIYFLVNFTNLSWKEFNIISIYWVELYLFCFFLCMFFVLFLFGSCFCLFSIHEKDRGLRQHTIYVQVYYILFFHFLQLWLLSLNAMCCGLQLVLWFHLLALLNLGSRLHLEKCR